MKIPRFLPTALFAVFVLTTTSRAADASGNWKWTSMSKTGPTEITAALLLKAGVLTGTVTTRQGPADIAEASVKGDLVSFSVTRSSGSSTVVFKYSGKLSGDTLTGTIEKTGPTKDTPPVKSDWKATRVK